MKWRARTKEVGRHVHVCLFVAQSDEHTFEFAGEITLNPDELEEFRDRLDLKVTQREIIDQEATDL